MKIVSSGKAINSSQFYQKKRKRRQIFTILIALGIIIFISAFVYLSRYEKFLINDVSVSGEEVAKEGDIVQATDKLLLGNYFWFIPRSNVLFYPKGAIKAELTKEFPQLKTIDLSLEKLQTLSITVEERKPSSLYCIGGPIEDRLCYFLDEESLIFLEAPSFSGGAVYFTYLTSEPLENPLGKRLLPVEDFDSINKFMENLSTLNLKVSALEVGKEDYIVTLSAGGKILFRRDTSLSVVYSNLEAFLSNDSIEAQKNFLEKIESLDLRIDDKVFYKFKD